MHDSQLHGMHIPWSLTAWRGSRWSWLTGPGAKGAWRYLQRSDEAELLKLCQERGVKGIAVLYCYSDDNEQSTAHGILDKCLPDAVALDLNRKGQKRGSPHPSSTSSRQPRSAATSAQNSSSSARSAPQDSLRITQSAVGPVASPTSTKGSFSALSSSVSSSPIDTGPTYVCVASGEHTLVPDRTYTCVVTVRGKPLSETSMDPLVVLCTMRDAVRSGAPDAAAWASFSSTRMARSRSMRKPS